jgi:hypothetical protein
MCLAPLCDLDEQRVPSVNFALLTPGFEFQPPANSLSVQKRRSQRVPAAADRTRFFHFLFDGGRGKREKKAAMKSKDVLQGLCVAALLVTAFFLFSANQKKTAAETAASDAQHQVKELTAQVAQLKADNAAAQATDIVSLRAENKNLSQKFSQLQSDYTRLDSTNKMLLRQLSSLSEAASQQQEQLRAWAAASQQASQQATMAAREQTQAQKKAAQERDACIRNLKEIDAAKQKWALVNDKTDMDIPTERDLQPYFSNNVMPVCPSGGTYGINAVGLPPTCPVVGHAIP